MNDLRWVLKASLIFFMTLKVLAECPSTFYFNHVENKSAEHLALQAAKTGLTTNLLEIIQAHPAAVFAVTETGDTLLHLISARGHAKTADLLKKYGSQTMPFLYYLNNRGLAPVHLAAIGGHKKMMSWFNEIHPKSAFILDENGNTPAHFAAKHGRKELLEIIGETAPKSFLIENKKGITPVQTAFIHEQPPVIDYFISRNFVNLKLLDPELSLLSPFIFVSLKGLRTSVLAGLEQGVDIHTIDPYTGRSGFLSSAGQGHFKTALTFLEKGARISDRDFEGNTFWHLTAKRNYTRTAEELARWPGAEELIHIKNKEGKTALDISLELKHSKMIKILAKSAPVLKFRSLIN